MTYGKIVFSLGAAALALSSPSYAGAGSDKADPQEIVQKVQEAAKSLSAAGEQGLAEFNKKPSPWVWKDTWVVVIDCNKGITVAHPVKPDNVGKDFQATKDTKGNAFLVQVCAAAKQPSGGWVEHWSAKPGQTEGTRKVSYGLKAGNTPYVVYAGVYDDKVTIEDLAKVSGGK